MGLAATKVPLTAGQNLATLRPAYSAWRSQQCFPKNLHDAMASDVRLPYPSRDRVAKILKTESKIALAPLATDQRYVTSVRQNLSFDTVRTRRYAIVVR